MLKACSLRSCTVKGRRCSTGIVQYLFLLFPNYVKELGDSRALPGKFNNMNSIFVFITELLFSFMFSDSEISKSECESSIGISG